MKNGLRIIALVLMLMLLMFSVPSGNIIALAEETISLSDYMVLDSSLSPIPLEDKKAPLPLAEAFTENGYEDDSLSISIEEVRAYDTTILIARIKLKHPSQLRTAMWGSVSDSKTGHAATLSKQVNAVFAINGDFFKFENSGFLIRQGHTYRKNPVKGSDILIVDGNADLHIIVDATKEKLEAFEGEIVNGFSFGPALIVDGEMVKTEFTGNIGYNRTTQRMVFAQDGPLSYVCVATEGPENTNSIGLTIDQIREFMGSLGVQQAYNLDGGSSSTMVLNNKKINALSTGKIRAVSDIIYFATLVGQE